MIIAGTFFFSSQSPRGTVEGIPLAHLMSRHIFSKRTRQIILEVNQAELDHLIQTEENVAVLLQDDSKVNYFCYQKTSKSGRFC